MSIRRFLQAKKKTRTLPQSRLGYEDPHPTQDQLYTEKTRSIAVGTSSQMDRSASVSTSLLGLQSVTTGPEEPESYGYVCPSFRFVFLLLFVFVAFRALTNPGQTVDDLLDEDELEAELAEGG